MIHPFDYGPCFVIGGKHKGKAVFYDEEFSEKRGYCFLGTPFQSEEVLIKYKNLVSISEELFIEVNGSVNEGAMTMMQKGGLI